jgi:hypothetical protein
MIRFINSCIDKVLIISQRFTAEIYDIFQSSRDGLLIAQVFTAGNYVMSQSSKVGLLIAQKLFIRKVSIAHI